MSICQVFEQVKSGPKLFPVRRGPRYVVQLLIHAMLLRYIFIRSSKRSGADTEIPDADIFESDIRPSLEGHGFFEYILRISENIWYLVTQAMGHKASR